MTTAVIIFLVCACVGVILWPLFVQANNDDIDRLVYDFDRYNPRQEP